MNGERNDRPRARGGAALLSRLDRLVTADRVRAWAVILIVGYLAAFAWTILTLRHGLTARGLPPGADFIIFYATSILTLHGKAALVYAPHALLAAERMVFPAGRAIYLWVYPPTFQLVVWPLALIPYGAALAAWTAAGLAAYLAMVRLISRDPRALLLALAFPAAFMNAAQGQNGFFTAALMGGGLLLLDRRPLTAGALLGLLVIKPQLGLLLPFILIGTGRWKSVLGAAASLLGLVCLATLAFGADSWPRALHGMRAAGHYLATGAEPLYKVPSLFAGLLRWGLPPPVALTLHALSALIAVALMLRAWRRPGSLELKAGLAVLATFIALPYQFDYDLALLAIPIGVGLKAAIARPSPPGTRCALALLAAAPIIVAPLELTSRLPLGPIALWCGFLALSGLIAAEPGLEEIRAAGSVGPALRAGNG